MLIYQKDTKNQEDDTNTAQNEETQGQANATLTTSNIKELVKSMMQEFKPSGQKANLKPLASQVTDGDGNKITYFWTHGITKNLRHPRKSCKQQK